MMIEQKNSFYPDGFIPDELNQNETPRGEIHSINHFLPNFIAKLEKEIAYRKSKGYDKPIKQKLVVKKMLSDKDEFSYCPFCKERVMRGLTQGESWKENTPLLIAKVIKYAVQIDESTAKIGFDEVFECPTCRKDFTIFDILAPYTNIENIKPKTIDLSNPHALDDF